MTLPNFLIIGAQKAGTTALYYALSKHPELFMSSNKEPQYFASESELSEAAGPGDSTAGTVDTLPAYEELFVDAAPEQAIGEASTIYLYAPRAPGRISELLPAAKLIAMLRNPVDRAYSNFLHLVRDGRETADTFGIAITEEDSRRNDGWSTNWRYREKGLYAPQIERYTARFAADQIRWYLYEDFNAAPHSTIVDIYRFLEVDDLFTQDLTARLNVGGMPKSNSLQRLSRNSERLKWAIEPLLPAPVKRRLLSAQNRNLARPSIDASLRAELIAYFRADMEKVADLTGLDTSTWK